ncbi:MAG: hypothetical protein M3373_09170 [Gemmatimonadota bacterium]|nr:hypothetical protein [Gemmatimonadota bacterium]
MLRLRSALAAITLAWIVVPRESGGQEQPRVTGLIGIQAGLSGGVALPVGDLNDRYGPGFRIAGHVGAAAAFFPIGVRFDVVYDRLAGGSVTPPGVGGPARLDDAGIWSGVLNLVVRLAQPERSTLEPYLLGGAGVFHVTSYGVSHDGAGNTYVDSAPSRTKFGLHVGGGVRYPLFGLNSFAEIKLVNVFGGTLSASGADESAARWIPITVGFTVPLGG